MTYEEVKKIRKNPVAEECENKELHRMIDRAIEKQIAKRITKGKYAGDCDCGHLVFYAEKFCSACGQRLDWSGKK